MKRLCSIKQKIDGNDVIAPTAPVLPLIGADRDFLFVSFSQSPYVIMYVYQKCQSSHRVLHVTILLSRNSRAKSFGSFRLHISTLNNDLSIKALIGRQTSYISAHIICFSSISEWYVLILFYLSITL